MREKVVFSKIIWIHRCIYSMAVVKESSDSITLFKVLSNPKRVTILQYLQQCVYATNSVIVKNTGIPQPQVTDALKKLQKVLLVSRERAGKRVVYQVNPSQWDQIKHLIS